MCRMEVSTGNGRKRERKTGQNTARLKQEPGAAWEWEAHPADLDWLCQNREVGGKPLGIATDQTLDLVSVLFLTRGTMRLCGK